MLTTASTRSPVLAIVGSNTTVAFSDARLTPAVATPGWRASAFSTRAAHEPHVIPVIANSTSVRSARISGVSVLVTTNSQPSRPARVRPR